MRQRSEAVNHRKTSSYTGRASALTKIERRAVMCGGLGNASQRPAIGGLCHEPCPARLGTVVFKGTQFLLVVGDRLRVRIFKSEFSQYERTRRVMRREPPRQPLEGRSPLGMAVRRR